MIFISIIIPVYNGERHIKQAIQSIINQTYTDFELVVVDDGSTDDTVKIVESFADRRIRLLKNEENQGLIYSLNRAIDESSGKYIARMDSDDIFLPQRLEKQYAFMEAHPEVVVVGGQYRLFGSLIQFRKQHYLPTTFEATKITLLFQSPFVHPATMMRRELFVKHGQKYDEDYNRIEDYDLWVHAQQFGKIANIEETLLLYRTGGGSITSSSFSNNDMRIEREKKIKMIFRRLLENYFNYAASESEIDSHFYLHNPRILIEKISIQQVEDVEKWLRKLGALNKASQMCDEKLFYNELQERFTNLIKYSSYLGFAAYTSLSKSPFVKPSFLNSILYMIRWGEIEMLIKKRV